MALIAVPNVSEGRDAAVITRLQSAIEATGARVLDVHSDALHNRSVFTLAGTDESLIESAASLAGASLEIDLEAQDGLHPRLGGLDVFPFVPINGDLSDAVNAARLAGKAIAQRAHLPVYMYEAASPHESQSLPSLRKGGLPELIRRAREGFLPDFGPSRIDPRQGVVCVGARGPLIAFNVQLECDADTATRLAAETRTSGGGLPHIRALGWGFGPAQSQISMNLVRPEKTGIDDVFEYVSAKAKTVGVPVLATEIVGLPPARFMPDPKKEAARLLIRPGRSLETELQKLGD